MATKLFTNIDLTGNPLKALPNVYDNQAFTLTRAQDKLIDLLTFVLVDHADGPGWGKPYTGANSAVFRAPIGTRHYLRVDESDAGYYVDVRAFENMTDVDTGGNETPDNGDTSRWYKGASVGSSDSDWFILCDEQFFYYGFSTPDDPTSSGTFLVQGFGRGVELDPASNYLTILYSSSSTSTAIYGQGYHPLHAADGNTAHGHLLRSYDNSGTNLNFRHAPTFSGLGSTLYLTGGNYYPPAPSPVSGQVDFGRAEAFIATGSNEYAAVCEIPGVRPPRAYYRDGYLVPNRLNLLVGTNELAGSNFLCVRTTHNLYPNPLVFDLGNWR